MRCLHCRVFTNVKRRKCSSRCSQVIWRRPCAFTRCGNAVTKETMDIREPLLTHRAIPLKAAAVPLTSMVAQLGIVHYTAFIVSVLTGGLFWRCSDQSGTVPLLYIYWCNYFQHVFVNMTTADL